MILTWLTGKPRNAMSMLQKPIDDLNKKEKVYLEKAAIKVEEAEEHRRENSKHRVVHCLKIKVMYEGLAQNFRNLQLMVHDELILMERMKKEMIEALQAKDLTTKNKTTSDHVFIYISFLVLVLTYYIVSLYLAR
ncbi:vacuolar protein sorting-associated protein 32 homolog 2-like isoform X2 [Capsella rubella]|uniref:vacuolar protein sorting-associated protein 32 homolog 2-like isoform X2 n=1 Tax=Capsella rubella TaxID=81985 RepID=UPI000CD4ED4C|nr:vacuolar protein sorting-associated protein 32 homolog 2-like isoform X2 [Capsella rubella]